MHNATQVLVVSLVFISHARRNADTAYTNTYSTCGSSLSLKSSSARRKLLVVRYSGRSLVSVLSSGSMVEVMGMLAAKPLLQNLG